MDICWRGSDNVGEYMTHGSLLLSTSFERNDQKDNNGGLFYNNNDDGSVFTHVLAASQMCYILTIYTILDTGFCENSFLCH